MTIMNHVPALADAGVLVPGTGRTGRTAARQALGAGADGALSERTPHRRAAAPLGTRTEAAEPEGSEDTGEAAGPLDHGGRLADGGRLGSVRGVVDAPVTVTGDVLARLWLGHHFLRAALTPRPAVTATAAGVNGELLGRSA